MKVYCIEGKDYVASHWKIENVLKAYNKKLNKNCTLEEVRVVDLDNEKMLFAVDHIDNEEKYDLEHYMIDGDSIWEEITFREAINRNKDLNYDRPYLICSTYFYEQKGMNENE